MGHQVVAVDNNQSRIEMVRQGKSPILEPGLEPLLQQYLKSGNLRFTNSPNHKDAPIYVALICVGTPWGNEGQLDLSQLWESMRSLAPHLAESAVVVIRSTIPFEAPDKVEKIIRDLNPKGDSVKLVVNPEFLREGTALNDFFRPSRIVIGSKTREGCKIVRKLYKPLLDSELPQEVEAYFGSPVKNIPWLECDINSALMIKYASNAFLATRVSMINEVALICGQVGANIRDVVQGMGYDPRIGSHYLSPGAGFGGPCLEKDLKTLLTFASSSSLDISLLPAVLQRNQLQILGLVKKLEAALDDSLQGKKVALYGLAFKANTNDLRDSPSLKAIDLLQTKGAQVMAYDPMIQRNNKGDLRYFSDPYQAVIGAQGLLVLTAWPQFKELDYSRIKKLMAYPLIIDGRNILNGSFLRRLGFQYSGIGD